MSFKENRLKTLIVISVALLLVNVQAFTGESAGASKLLDFLTKKDLKKVGESSVGEIMTMCQRYYIPLLLINPNIMNDRFLTVSDYLVALLGPVFIFAILFVGAYLVLFSGSPTTRAKIKSMLPGVFAAMVLVILSPHIMNLILYFSENLCRGVVEQGVPNSIVILLPLEGNGVNPIDYLLEKFQTITWYSAEASFPFLFMALILLVGVLAIVIARYLIVSLFVMIFPLTVFLYLFLPSRQVGRLLMEQSIVWIFLQVIQAITLLSLTTILGVLAPFLVEEVMVILKLSGLIILVIIPVATIFFIRDFLPG